MRPWSVIIATQNRREALARTLRAIPDSFEIIIADNRSTDGTPAMVRAERSSAAVITLPRNFGPVAKTFALERVSHPLVAALDDDAAPEPWTWEVMARRFDDDPRLVCAGWGVRIADTAGSPRGWDCGALPRVFAGAAAAFRAQALRDIRGWDLRCFMQAEEYDLVFRLASRGGRCDVFFDLPALHHKDPAGRAAARTLRLDARNNARFAAQHLPEPWATLYAADWACRYRALGRLGGRAWAADLGLVEATLRAATPTPMTTSVFEDMFGHARIRAGCAGLLAAGVRRVILAQWGKNALAFDTASKRVGLSVVAVADDRFASAGLGSYRGAPVRSADAAMHESFDAVLIADSAPIHAAAAAARWRAMTAKPVVAFDAADLAAIEQAGDSARHAA